MFRLPALPWILFWGRLCVYEDSLRVQLTKKASFRVRWGGAKP